MIKKVQEIIKENNKYRLVFETNETTGVQGVFVIETSSGNMLCNFSDESKAIKQWEEQYSK